LFFAGANELDTVTCVECIRRLVGRIDDHLGTDPLVSKEKPQLSLELLLLENYSRA
jgi:hypothetical protein